jgi:magnesium chelatase subunit H
MRFVFFFAESSFLASIDSALANLEKEYGLKIQLKIWTVRQLPENSPAWADFERDFLNCDFFMANMIAQPEQSHALEALIRKHAGTRPERPIVIMNSMPSLIGLTRLGDFEFNKFLAGLKNNPVAKIGGLFGKLRGKGVAEQDEDYDPDEKRFGFRSKKKPVKRAGGSSTLVNLVRTAPAILKLIPGGAQHIRAYIMIMLYWMNCTPENVEEFFKFVIARYLPHLYKGKKKLQYRDPQTYPKLALFHPDAPEQYWESRAEFEKWLAKNKPHKVKQPRVGLLMFQMAYLAGNRRHVTELVRQIEALDMVAVPSFSSGLDFRQNIETFFVDEDKNGQTHPNVDILLNVAGFAIAGGPAASDPDAAVFQLKRANVPVWASIILSSQSEDEWRESWTGLNPFQAALQISVPELDGALEPRVYAADVPTPGDKEKSIHTFPVETRRIVRRLAKFVKLARMNNRDKKLAVILFCYPPNKGNIGTAAYLAVFESMWRTLKRLKDEGYTVDLPADAEELRKSLVEGNSLTYGTNANLHAHLPTADYMRLFDGWQEIEKTWGSPPGHLLSDHLGIQILGKQFGNILVAIQPTFGYEDDPMRLLMGKNVATHHGFAGFYTYLEKVWNADAVLHFGTHGAHEFMPGKQIGLTAECWSDRLIGELPNFYLYCVNNPSEGSIAKRRGFATLLSYLTPALETAGLYKQLTTLKDTINQYRKVSAQRGTLHAAADSGGAMPDAPSAALLESIIEQAAALEMKPKIEPFAAPDEYVMALYADLLEIEERLIPTGLHILDEPPSRAEISDVLNSISSFSRGKAGSDDEAASLTGLIAGALGYDLEDVRENAAKDSAKMEQWETISRYQREAIEIFVQHAEKQPERAKKEAAHFLQQQIGVGHAQSDAMWDYLAGVTGRMQQTPEISQVIRALRGEFIEPSPGSNVVQNPAVLPTGRNIHALDPNTIPTPLARRNGEKIANQLIERAATEAGLAPGEYPETVAMILWGTDNIKSDGEGIAQTLALLGARAITDGLGRVSSVKLLPLEELGRPRMDVVVTVSGIFRDLMPNQMALIDRAVRLAAEADEPEDRNFVKKHVNADMSAGKTFREATVRVFSNAPGQYGANVNFAVENSAWENDDELSEMFLNRKSFAFGVNMEGDDARALMENALRRVEVSFQNVDSAETGLTDVDHYYEYLGGVTKTVEKLRGKRPATLVADSLSSTSGGLSQGKGVKTLEEAVRLESRTKMLNPKWYESMLNYGFEGVREIESRLSHTFGFSATAHAVDGWIYKGAYDTFINDETMRERLQELNPYSLKTMVGRLLEANGRGFWDADPAIIERLKEIYAGLEDEIEGVATLAGARG